MNYDSCCILPPALFNTSIQRCIIHTTTEIMSKFDTSDAKHLTLAAYIGSITSDMFEEAVIYERIRKGVTE